MPDTIANARDSVVRKQIIHSLTGLWCGKGVIRRNTQITVIVSRRKEKGPDGC